MKAAKEFMMATVRFHTELLGALMGSIGGNKC